MKTLPVILLCYLASCILHPASAAKQPNIIFIFLFAAIATIGVNRSYRTRTGKMVFDRLMIRAPILGALLLKIAIARFCRTLSTLTSSGVPILEGLQITARTSGNAVVEEAILSVRKSVSEGKTISDPLAATKLFPGMVVSMIAVGEQTGALDQMLAKIADFYEEEVDNAVTAMTSLLEPVMIVFLAVIVGSIVIAMFLPLIKMMDKLGQ